MGAVVFVRLSGLERTCVIFIGFFPLCKIEYITTTFANFLPEGLIKTRICACGGQFFFTCHPLVPLSQDSLPVFVNLPQSSKI